MTGRSDKSCAACGATFTPSGNYAKYCGDECRAAANRRRQREYEARDPVASRARKHAYVERHPERRRQTAKADWERKRADPERYARFLEQGRESYSRHPETGYLYALNYRARNRERVREANRRYGAERRERVGVANHLLTEYAPVLRRDPCAYCGGDGGTIDHIEPLAAGCDHAVENLAGACRTCNARKRTRPLLAFLLAQSR